MMTSRSVNTLLALVLFLGQLAGGIHLASHAEPVHVAQSAQMSFHTTAGVPEGTLHEKSECAACHFAANHLVVTDARLTVSVDLSAGVQIAPDVATSTTAALTAAYTIRAPPSVS